jgi:hypothetical protein
MCGDIAYIKLRDKKMTTVASARYPSKEDSLCQGDIFKEISYTYIDSEDDEGINLIALEFPLSIVVSQACDVTFMSDLQKEKKGKATKYMPSILMCPIYNKEQIRSATHISDISHPGELSIDLEKFYTSEDIKIAEKDYHYRFHVINIKVDDKQIINDAVIDFKHYFSVPASYLLSRIENRLYSLDTIFYEQVTLKFAAYLSRVAIP